MMETNPSRRNRPQLIQGLLRLPPPSECREQFQQRGFVVIERGLTEYGHTTLTQLVARLTSQAARKDFLMPQSGMTPRHMTVFGGALMNRENDITVLYHSAELIGWCQSVTGWPVSACPDESENIIITILDKPGDTHGWHFDDYPFAFIIVVDTPPPDDGGYLEIRDSAGAITREVLRPKDVYLMRTDNVAHRVAPLVRATRRVICNLTYSSMGWSVAPNGSADLLCRP